MANRDHWVHCESCHSPFASILSRNQHMNTHDHWDAQIECHSCKRMFDTQNAANEHMRDYNHFPDHSCAACDNPVESDTPSCAHTRTKVRSDIMFRCPYCKGEYIAPSGIPTHIEAGVCTTACATSRRALYERIQYLDPTGMITNGAADGCDWICRLCLKDFFDVDELISHLDSPIHDAKIYHCLTDPNVCGRRFSSLSALFSHLEHGSCGYLRFVQIETILMNLLRAIDGGKVLSTVRLE
ncbi:uncharacterized protein N7506_002503 [Penicillium brevicompactum]|uniref:uncharacterized protein n=1 Tax=Penicillium brevicompactum TaxID=5074 RepID=UPI00253F98E0|nr:uncharacterized protein N7506_002503 [Penicillium brevicompactum]KAJ5344138.1 hypothetical protein N7506_002503 [Penicillium brevicompactum]